jgi:hypothetical protein
MRSRHSAVGDAIRSSGKLEDDTVEKLKSAVEDFKTSYTERVETIATAAAEELENA